MKRFVVYLLTVSLIISGSLYPRKSQAFVGVAGPVFNFASVLWIVGGIAAFGTAVYAFNVADGIDCDDFKTCSGRYGLKILGVVLGVAGIIALDDKAPSSIAELNLDQKEYYGLSKEQFESFNSQIDEINAIIQTAAGKLQAELEKNENLELEKQVALVEASYAESNKSLTEDTLAALSKIKAKISNELKAKQLQTKAG